MNILVYTQYFPPETNAPANRWGYFTKYLAEQGHKITVLTSFPNHPLGRVLNGYKNQWRFAEEKDSMKIIHTWTYISSSRKFFSRLFNYFSFVFSSYINSFSIINKDVDMIIASSPPLSVAIMGTIIAKKRKIPLILDLRDIWPEAAVSTGYIKKGLLYRLAEKWERNCYKQAQKILVNSPAIFEELKCVKGVSPKKMELVLNGADLEFFQKTNNGDKIDEEYDIKDKFVVLYTGLLGFAQAPEIMIEAAKILKNNKSIVFLIVGGGPLKKNLESRIKNLELKNVILTGQRPRKEMPDFVGRGDICLVPYKNSFTFQKNVPSKMFDYMSSGKPIIINLEGAASDIIRKAQAGFVVEPENASALAKAIEQLYDNRFLRKKMGDLGKSYAEKYYDKKKISSKLETILKNVAE